MSSVEQFPGRFHRQRAIKGDIWKAPEPSDLMAWEVCPHLLMAKGLDDWRCKGCPAWRVEEAAKPYSDDGEGLVKDGCRMMAEEVCRVVMAVQMKEAEIAAVPPENPASCT